MVQDFCGVILRVDNPNFKRSPSYEIKIWGKSMLEWVSSVFWEEPIIYADITGDEKSNVALIDKILKDNNFDRKYIAVLFSDTPLVTRRTIMEAVEYCQENDLDYVKMTRGYIIKKDCPKSFGEVVKSKTHYFSFEDDFLTAYNFKTLSLINEVQKQRIIERHMHNGVYFLDPSSVFIDDTVEISSGATIYPNNHFLGSTKISEGAVLFDGNFITDSVIGQNAQIRSSNISGSFIGNNTVVGPFAYLRPESYIGEDCRIGDFVEIKKARIGNKTKVAHLTYIGDCELGQNCNVGCGVVFCNYDGKSKHFSKVGDNVFIGSNTNIISPVVIEDNAFIAAGSTINQDVPKGNLAIARARQVNKPDYIRKKLED
jgi:bifunctional N-acetylglucosamine-1-phosphate-uridyltransferase/glucosamine-1-phosphate-acetyltransferase GlmU-like protein